MRPTQLSSLRRQWRSIWKYSVGGWGGGQSLPNLTFPSNSAVPDYMVPARTGILRNVVKLCHGSNKKYQCATRSAQKRLPVDTHQKKRNSWKCVSLALSTSPWIVAPRVEFEPHTAYQSTTEFVWASRPVQIRGNEQGEEASRVGEVCIKGEVILMPNLHSFLTVCRIGKRTLV